MAENLSAMELAVNYLIDRHLCFEADDLIAKTPEDEKEKERLLKSLYRFGFVEDGELEKVVYFQRFSDLFRYLVLENVSKFIWLRAVRLFPIMRAIYFVEFIVPWVEERTKDMSEEDSLEFLERVKKEWQNPIF